MNPGLNVALFYVSVAALAVGLMRTARAAVERKVGDRAGLAIAACGVLGLLGAVVAFVTGPRTVLPF